MADFFDKEEPKEIKEEPKEIEKVKVGEDEYSQEELSKLVGLGKLGAEAEDKFNTKLDRVWPEYTKKSQRVAELEKELDTAKKTAKKKADTGETLSLEELKSQAISQADELGIVHKGNVNQFISQFMQARDLISDAGEVVSAMGEEGKPKTTVDDLLGHMEKTGIKSPQRAYNDMFEGDIDKWKEVRLGKIKKTGMATTESSTAGSKQPTPTKVTKGNLQELLKQSLEGQI